MRVTIDANIFSRQRFGGISRYVEELARALQNHSDLEMNVANIFSIQQGSIFPAIRVQKPARGSGLIAEVDSWLSSHLLWRGSILHLPYHSAWFRNVKMPVVLTVHDLIPERQGLPSTSVVDKRRKFWIQRADVLICVSESTRRDLIKFYNVDESRTRVVYHGADHLTPLRATFGRVAAREVLYVGGRQSYKGFADLVVAFSKSKAMRTHRLVLVGGGPLQPSEIRLMSEFGISPEAVVWIEGNDQLLVQKLQNVDALILPSHWEGFNLPGVEAARLGCPIVARDTLVHKEILGDAATYFDADDPESFIASLDYVCGNPKHRLEGSSRLPRDYSWFQAAAQTASIYRDLAQ